MVNVEVEVGKFEDIDGALRKLKKTMLKDGVFKEMKKRAYYEKPSQARRRKQAEARKKVRKNQKKREEYDAKFENAKRRQDDPLKGVIG
jgi:small subunit ribosomal protein S21